MRPVIGCILEGKDAKVTNTFTPVPPFHVTTVGKPEYRAGRDECAIIGASIRANG
jgi:hypothetical protein